MNSILVCTDLSPVSKNAIRYAAKLAAALDTELIPVHIVYYPGELPLTKQKDLELNAKLVLAGEDLKRQHKVKVRTEKRAGLPVDEILSIAKKYHAGLIV